MIAKTEYEYRAFHAFDKLHRPIFRMNNLIVESNSVFVAVIAIAGHKIRTVIQSINY